MPSLPLPENPSLEHLRNQAKLVQQLVAEGDPGALDLLTEFHPRIGESAPAEQLARFRRSDAQLVVARLYGFASWTRLRQHLDAVSLHSRADTADHEPDDAADRFAALGCVTYSDQPPLPRLDQAHRLLADRPELATASIAAAVTAGNHDHLAALLAADPELVERPCGPNRWPPLLYACYSRINGTASDSGSGSSTLSTARLLLEAGADPNAGFLWRGLLPPFTALTGALGRGEQRQPPHPHRLDLARLLLTAGADPNDGQALYNNGLAGSAHDDPGHLQLLVAHGLGTARNGPWYQRFGDQLTPPEQLLWDELEVAASRGLPRRMRYLISLGLDLEAPVGRSGLTPARIAVHQGQAAILDILADAGVQIDLGPVERLLVIAGRGAPEELLAAAASDPAAAEQLRRDRPALVADLLIAAATAGAGAGAGARSIAVIKALADLGFDLDARTGGAGITALHEAASNGDIELVRALLDAGADPMVTDTHFGATPLAWAEHGGSVAVADLLRPLTGEGPPNGGR